MIPVLVAATLLAPSVDTLRIPALTMRPAVDGRIDAGEYGEPVISLRAGAGVVQRGRRDASDDRRRTDAWDGRARVDAGHPGSAEHVRR